MKRFTWLFLLAAAGCAGGPPVEHPNPSDIDRLTFDEIRSSTKTDAYSVIQELRPTWDGVAYLDGQPLGTMEELVTVPVDMVESMERLHPIQARARYGIIVAGEEVIMVTRRN